MRQAARRLRLVGLAPRALEIVQVVQVRGELAPNAGHGAFAVVVDDPGKLPGRDPDEGRCQPSMVAMERLRCAFLPAPRRDSAGLATRVPGGRPRIGCRRLSGTGPVLRR